MRRRRRGASGARWFALPILSVLLVAGSTAATGAARAGQRSRRLASTAGAGRAGPSSVAAAASDAASVAKAYVEQFYPLWFTYLQVSLAPHNQLIGPSRISPIYHAVVAINDDTLYASAPIDVSSEPVILTVPPTTAGYSVLTMDPYGNVFTSGVPSKPAGTSLPQTVYGLVAPGYSGSLPAGVTRVQMPLDLTLLIFRVDKYAPDGTSEVQAATAFRAGLKLQPLSGYLSDPSGGAARILPEIYFGFPVKTIADSLVSLDPIRFLAQLQTAVHSSNTPPMTAAEQALSSQFDTLFGSGGSSLDAATRLAMSAGAQAAHSAIVSRYLDNRGPNNWIHFTNIGAWGDQVLDRAAITEFIQFGNGISTAAYYQTFLDSSGQALSGSVAGGYVVTLPAGQPPAGRFWSLTAYTPQAIELVPNTARKYLVASYTPGLQKNANGSISIYVARQKPAGVPAANWLPVSSAPFNLMLRVYGVKPGSSVADNTYVPPPVVRGS